MTRKTDKELSFEDRILWSKVARTAKPLPGKAVEDKVGLEEQGALDRGMADFMASGETAPGVPATPVKPPAGPRRIDAPVRAKLAKGRIEIDGKIDLHGLTQGEAYGLLLSFLHRAHSSGRRNLLVVTGKGSSMGSEGVLRRVVPAWLATPAFRGLVHSHSDAARRHGGTGALYIRLRRSGGGLG